MVVQTYQRLHCTMQRMSVIPPELRVGAFERRVSVGLWLLDTVRAFLLALATLASS